MARFWFKPRRYGYGAAPATWEGWTVTVASMAIVFGSIVAMNLLVDRSNFAGWMIWAVLMAVLVWCFVQFCRRRTDGEWRWRWGECSDTPKAGNGKTNSSL
jgi:Na+/melibiose symporter-like transporter